MLIQNSEANKDSNAEKKKIMDVGHEINVNDRILKAT